MGGQFHLPFFIMDKASELVSSALLGLDIRIITVGGKSYKISPPSIRTILEATRHFAKVDVEDSPTEAGIIKYYEANTPHITRGIAAIIRGSDGLLTRRLAKRLTRGTYKELADALVTCINLMGGQDFFAIASLLKSIRKTVASRK